MKINGKIVTEMNDKELFWALSDRVKQIADLLGESLYLEYKLLSEEYNRREKQKYKKYYTPFRPFN